MNPTRVERDVVSEGTLRVGPLMALPDVLADLGVDAGPVLAEFGLTRGDFQDPDNTLPFRTLGALLRRGSEATGSDRLGLLIGRSATLSSLGAIGFLMQSSPTVGSAMRALVKNLHLHDRGAIIDLHNRDGLAQLDYAVIVAGIEEVDQIHIGAALIANTIMLTLCGSGWRAHEVHLPVRRPSYVPELQRELNAPLRFEAERVAIVFASTDLDRTPPTADPLLHRMMSERIRELEAIAHLGVADRARRLIATMVLVTDCTPAVVANRLGMSLRTLNRRLADEGTSLQRLRDEACRDVACQLLAHTTRPAREIGSMLGYSDAGAFTRAFTRWVGIGPAKWRATRARGRRRAVGPSSAGS